MTGKIVGTMEKKQPLVSVVIPNYNYARYLTRRIESVLQQTFTDYELILLDDASTDGSVEVLERYRGHEHVSQLVVNGENSGSPFVQWLRGIRLARGKYVWIAEADDDARPDFLETCVSLAEHYDDVAICFAGSKLFDADGRVERRDVNHWGRRGKKLFACFDGRAYAEHNLYWKNYIINASGAIFRRDYALRLPDMSFVTMRFCGDWMFWFEMALQGKVVEVYRNLNFFRQHPAKATVASHRHGDGIREDVQIVRMMEGYLPALPVYKKRLRRGLLFRKIRRMHLSQDEKEKLYAHLSFALQSGMADYWLERRNQFLRLLPGVVSAKKDRL